MPSVDLASNQSTQLEVSEFETLDTISFIFKLIKSILLNMLAVCEKTFFFLGGGEGGQKTTDNCF